jgi:hypothetical protein
MPKDHRHFICPDNPQNRQQHADLDNMKKSGWRVIDAGKDALDPNIMIITLDGMSGTAKLSESQTAPTPKTKVGKRTVTLDARPDPLDFRDKLYVPSLVEVPSEWPLEQYLKIWGRNKPPILDQGQEGACTGFGLAAVAHFLLHRRKVHPDKTQVSPRMFYEMARRYDEWEGEAYSGSSARGAMKGWHKHGVCTEKKWPYVSSAAEGNLSPERAQEALRRPLGAYFRVDHKDLVAMHSSLADVGILYVTAMAHEGWGTVGKQGTIKLSPKMTGGHAFALVGYDENGFWLQNSWGPGWGRGGFAHLSYDDWLSNGTDVWVARLGAPVVSEGTRKNVFVGVEAGLSIEVRRAQLQQYTVAIGNDGRLRETGEVGNTKEDVERLLGRGGDFETTTRTWQKKRILLYAHGGLVSEKDSLQRVSEYLPALLEAEVYPIAFIWKTDFWSTISNILKDVLNSRRPEGLLDSAKDFMLDRLDDTLELVARAPGRSLWEEMKENAVLATEGPDGGARVVLGLLMSLLKRDPHVEIHFAGHSAGSIFLGPLLRHFCDSGKKVTSLNLWAPACTMEFFEDNYAGALKSGNAARFGLYTLKDPAERDDHCANIYHKSLLYLVAHACEFRRRVLMGDGTPLLGMEKFILQRSDLFGADADKVQKENPHAVRLKCGPDAWWIRSPNNLPSSDIFASTARHHGDFDDDQATVQSTLLRILGAPAHVSPPPSDQMEFRSTSSGLKARRQRLEKATGYNR